LIHGVYACEFKNVSSLMTPAHNNKQAHTQQYRSNRLESILFSTFLCYFIFKALFFAVRIREYIFPDEFSWFGLAELFSRCYLPPVDSPESIPFGLVTHVPTLYFFLMGKILGLNIFHVSDLIFLRFANVFLGAVTLAFAWKFICLISHSTAERLLFLVMLSNTLMFTFLFGAVSYDNLTNLLAVLTIYFVTKFTLNDDPRDLLLALMMMLAGVLTKITLLPFAVGIVVALFCYCGMTKGRFLRTGENSFFTSKTFGVSLVIILLLSGFAVKLYGGNWLQYGTLQPQMDRFFPLENCLQNRLFSRSYAVAEFKKGKLDLVDAQRIALRIRPESDRNETLMLLRYAAREKGVTTPPELVSRGVYTLLWGEKILQKIYGIMAHKSMEKTGRWDLAPYLGLLLLGGVGMVVRFREVIDSFSMAACLCWTVWYLLILSQLVNFNGYRYSGVMDMALQGRYIFPVLVPFYAVWAKALTALFRGRFRGVFVSLVSAFFVIAEFPWFLNHVTPDWYF